ncbi:hypothetical protein IC762_29840 [Bradyrhizobium genosp. L]|uniref:hypothetical protein n=1 Tax=Bradyrhizobium genosp. L TaxID=83637 RepID=UPI0018A3280F|nr:hypothetical protein [Bradyrhizobium genosp. L]QPF83839.1 hypothetical protein IC762_29840 [Bradyrhizobium genosp. L]
MDQRPDHGETSYKRSARLHEKRAIVTGGDRSIVHAVIVASARERADNLITNFDESKDAQEGAALVATEVEKSC